MTTNSKQELISKIVTLLNELIEIKIIRYSPNKQKDGNADC